MLILLCKKITLLKKDGQDDGAIRVTGTPGFGKSFFLGYVRYHLLKANCSVVAFVGTKILLSHKGRTCRIKYEQFEEIEDVIILADPSKRHLLPVTGGVTVFFVSPAEGRTGDYPRTNLINIYMPPWEKEELHDCITKVYPDCGDYFEDQYNKWGGSIRCLSRAPFEESRDNLLDDFLSDKCLVDVVNNTEKTEGILANKIQRYQWLVHMIPTKDDEGNTDYGHFGFSFPSDFIRLKVAHRIHGLKFDWKTVGQPKLLGEAYESHVLNSLFKVSQEKYFSVPAELVGKKNEKENIPAVAGHSVYSSKTKIEQIENCVLYIPIESNRPDFVMPPWIFQVTIAKSHTAKKLENVFQQFPSVEKWKLCFVLPLAIIEEFSTPRLSLYPSIEAVYKLPFDFPKELKHS